MLFIRFLPHLFVALAAAGALVACAAASTATQDATSFQKVILRDVTVLRGGRVVEVQSDGAVEVTIVAPGGKETHYAMQISREKVAELANLLAEHHFNDIEIEFRAPVPDEARPEIEVVWATGESVVKAKWANDVHPDFDAIYQWLLQLAEDAVKKGEEQGAGT